MRQGWETAARCAAGEPVRLHPEMRYAYMRVAEVFAAEAEWALHRRMPRRPGIRPYDIPLAVAVLPFTDFRLAAGARDPYGTIAARLAALLDRNHGDPLDRYSWELAGRCLQGETVILKPETREAYAAVGRLFEPEMRLLLHGEPLPTGLHRPYDPAEAVRRLPFRAFRQAVVGGDPYRDIARRLMASTRENTPQGARRYLHRLRWRLARTHAWTPGQIRRVWSIVLRFPDLVPVLGRITDLFPPPVELPIEGERNGRTPGPLRTGMWGEEQWGDRPGGIGALSDSGERIRECGSQQPAMSVGAMLAALRGDPGAAVVDAVQSGGFPRQGSPGMAGGSDCQGFIRAVLPGMPLSQGPAASTRQDGWRSARSPRRRRTEMPDRRLTLF